MTDAKEPILLKVVAPSSHTALSGDVTVFILDSALTELTTADTMAADANDVKKDENEKIDRSREEEVNAGHEPLVLRYVKTLVKRKHARTAAP